MSVRKLSNDDVIEIFRCIHANEVPEERLRFQIIVVGSNGMKLSPPSYKFKDGLYVLLKPLKKNKNKVYEQLTSISPEKDPRIPSNLKPFVSKETLEEDMPWSLSGPQFQKPCQIQQRYCYPKGNPDYSSVKGGSLWTEMDGRVEDINFRLLHVYYSAKRAGNKSTKKTNQRKDDKDCKKVRMMPPLPPLPSHQPAMHSHLPTCDSFGSTFSDDSPLSFQVSNSPMKDTSILPLFNAADSIDTDPESLISPDRGFFDIGSSFENSSGKRSSIDDSIYCTPKKTKKVKGEEVSNHSFEFTSTQTSYDTSKRDSYNRYCPPGHHYHHPAYWQPYHPTLYPSYSTNPHDRRSKAWVHPPHSATSYPVQQAKTTQTKDHKNGVTGFVHELKMVHKELHDAIKNVEPDRQEECFQLLSRWGHQICNDPRADFNIAGEKKGHQI